MPLNEPADSSLPGLGRTLVMAGKLEQKAAEEIYRKAQSKRTTLRKLRLVSLPRSPVPAPFRPPIWRTPCRWRLRYR